MDQPEMLEKIVTTGEVPKNIAEMISFEKNGISKNMFKAEMYAEYVEFYLTFVMNIVNKEYNAYYPFSLEKLQIVMDEFPLESAYYYIANNLLKTDETEQYKRVLGPFLELFPNGEMNDKVRAKYNELN